jgi:hypothetical protein
MIFSWDPTPWLKITKFGHGIQHYICPEDIHAGFSEKTPLPRFRQVIDQVFEPPFLDDIETTLQGDSPRLQMGGLRTDVGIQSGSRSAEHLLGNGRFGRQSVFLQESGFSACDRIAKSRARGGGIRRAGRQRGIPAGGRTGVKISRRVVFLPQKTGTPEPAVQKYQAACGLFGKKNMRQESDREGVQPAAEQGQNGPQQKRIQPDGSDFHVSSNRKIIHASRRDAGRRNLDLFNLNLIVKSIFMNKAG